MIGRTHELQTILGQVDAMCSLKHKQNVLFVTGEAGIGKSTMLGHVGELLGKRRGPTAPLAVLTECSTPLLGQDVGQVEALEPWAELLEKILEHDGEPGRAKEMVKLLGSVALTWVHVVPVVGGILESSIETAALLKEHAGGNDKTKAASQEQMFQQYVTFLAKASDAHPLVLILDDFHWADTSSTNLLFSAARHLAAKRVLFIVAYRADDAASSRDGKGHPILHVRNELGRYKLYQDVVVPKMTPRDLDGLLKDRYARYQGSKDFERWLADRSGGNALFVTQYLATLEEDGIVDAQSGEIKARFDNVRVPTTAFSVIEERTRRLDDESRELLRYASVEGATFTVSVLSALTEVPRLKLLQKLRLIAEKYGVIKCVGKQRIYASDSTAYQFTDSLMQRAMYEGLEEEEREELHKRIFRAIKQDFESAEDADSSIVGLAVRLAAHANNPADRLYAATLLLAAAETSWARFAEEETLSVLRALLTNLESLEATRIVTGKPRERDVRVLEGEARYLSGLVHKFRGRHAEALAEFRAARKIFEKIDDGAARARAAMVYEAFTLENARDFVEADRFSRDALERVTDAHDDRSRGAILNNLGLVLTGLGRAEEGLEYQRQSLEVRERIKDLTGQAVTLGSMGIAFFATGRYDEALAHHRRSLDIRAEIKDRVGQGYSLANIGNALAASGRIEEALEYHRKSIEVREACGDVLGLVASLENAAKLQMKLGRLDEAIPLLERAVRLAETLSNRRVEFVALRELGAALRERGDHARSRELLNHALELSDASAFEGGADSVRGELAKLPPEPERETVAGAQAAPTPESAPKNGTSHNEPKAAPHDDPADDDYAGDEPPRPAGNASPLSQRLGFVIHWIDRRLDLGLSRIR